MVKPKVCRNIVLIDQILMRACMTIDMSGGGDCGWLGEGFCLASCRSTSCLLAQWDFVFGR